MKRRDFVKALGAGALLTTGLGACGGEDKQSAGDGGDRRSHRTFNWKMVTTWPPNFPGLGTGAARLAERITAMSGGRLNVKVYGAGEIVPAFEVFDAVSRSTAEMGHGAAYYWKGKSQATQFFAAVPFGLNAQEMNAWLYYGGGLELWKELYEPFGILPAPAGNTGVQMGGWFNKSIDSVEDLKGLKMRIPGLGGEVLQRAGGTPVSMPGGEVFTSLQTGAIDATEWVGPYNDLAFGLHKAAKYYYYPGWHEPGSTLEALINRKAYEELPEDLKQIVTIACQSINNDMLAEYTARNHSALQKLIDEHGVEVRRFPDGVMEKLSTLSREVVEDMATGDREVKKVYEAYRKFLDEVGEWTKVSEQAYLDARS